MRFIACLLFAFVALPAPAAYEGPATGHVEAYFVPWDDAEGAILRALDSAQQTIHVQAFLITSRNLAQALLAAQKRGIAVAILADRERVEEGEKSLVPWLAEAGIPVWLESRYAAAHNKIILIDAESPHPIVITGSYNFTFSAQARNAENVLILRGDRGLSRAYLANWRRHREEAQPYRETMR